MKTFAAFSFVFVLAVRGYSQGLIQFNARALGPPWTVFAPIYGPQVDDPFAHLTGQHITNGGIVNYTGPLLVGTGFTAALYGGPLNSGIFDFLSTTTFRTGAFLPGIITPPNPVSVPVPTVPAGDFATFEMRAWDNRGGTVADWAAVMADPTISRGQSSPFSPPFPLGGTPPEGIPITPPCLQGLTSFNIAPVPEPGIIALGLLGLGALLLRRRK